MGAHNENAGISNLANVIRRRIKKETDTPLVLDFGEIQSNGSLITNTFPVSIPKGSYSVLSSLGASNDTDSASVSKGDRVLVAWVQSEAVVVGIVSDS